MSHATKTLAALGWWTLVVAFATACGSTLTTGDGAGSSGPGGGGGASPGQGGFGHLEAISLLGSQLPPDQMGDPQSIYVFIGDEAQDCSSPSLVPSPSVNGDWQVEVTLLSAAQHPGVVALDQSNCSFSFVSGPGGLIWFICALDMTAATGTLTINSIGARGVTGRLALTSSLGRNVKVNQDFNAPRCQ